VPRPAEALDIYPGVFVCVRLLVLCVWLGVSWEPGGGGGRVGMAEVDDGMAVVE
jgi:hypothetical protein